MKFSKIISTKTQEFSYEKGKILRVKLHKNATISLNDAQEGFKIAEQLTKGEKHFVLIDLRTSNNFSIEAKNYIAKEKENRNRVAEASIVSSKTDQQNTNLYYFSINKPSVPTQLFLDEKAAISWLESLQ